MKIFFVMLLWSVCGSCAAAKFDTSEFQDVLEVIRQYSCSIGTSELNQQFCLLAEQLQEALQECEKLISQLPPEPNLKTYFSSTHFQQMCRAVEHMQQLASCWATTLLQEGERRRRYRTNV